MTATTGADLARIALRAARQAACTSGSAPAQRTTRQTTTAPRRGSREPEPIAVVFIALVAIDSVHENGFWSNFCGGGCLWGPHHTSLKVRLWHHAGVETGTAEAVIEAEWAELLASDRVESGLVRAAYAEPRLRQLFPWVGMWELHFSRCTEHPCTWDVPYIAPRRGGGYVVAGPSREQWVGEADTAEAAVKMVAEHLPPGCGRAVVGNRHDVAPLAQES